MTPIVTYFKDSQYGYSKQIELPGKLWRLFLLCPQLEKQIKISSAAGFYISYIVI